MAPLKSSSLNILQMSLKHLFRPRPISFHLKPTSNRFNFSAKSFKFPSSHFFSATATPYPLQYEMIISHPTDTQRTAPSRRKLIPQTKPRSSTDPDEDFSSDLGLEDWVDRKLASNQVKNLKSDANVKASDDGGGEIMDKSKRKYYIKRRNRMFGETDSDGEDYRRIKDEGFVELKPEVVEFNTLHKREEELYFYDTFAFPWEKDKHYKMVYQLEKKYFPDQSLDKAFLDPGNANTSDDRSLIGRLKSKKSKKNKKYMSIGDNCTNDDKGLVFFDDVKNDESVMGITKDEKKDAEEKKVEEFFKCLKKVPNEETATGNVEPYLVTRSNELPPRWDGPNGTVVLVNKPKGWTSFTVCGKLRRLVQVKKVGHAGTLDPMATGLLIVCVGKATKLVDRYQGMIKGYSGVFRLGEATSTWDADSPVIQRELWEHIKDDDIKKAVSSFCGEIWQVPPMFSAIKVGGERMYDKARRGESIELSPRRISIFQFDVERSLDDRQNLIFKVICSKGTYIRSLCADLGKALGSCAHLTALRRDSIGEYLADDAWDFKDLEEAVTKIYL